MWENLKSVVNEVIKPNDNREITGEKHNSTLRTVINSLGKYAQFAGLAFKNTNPGTPDGPVFYFAAFKGVYLNFNRIEVEENEVAILNYNNNKWEKIVIGYSPIAPATIEDIRLTTLIDSINESNALKTNFEFKQDSILGVQLPFLHAAISHIDADGQLIKGKPTSETLILVPLAEASTDADTPGKHGFMSYQDKDLLDSIPNYTISGKKISENPILTYGDIQGVAYLGEDGKIPSSLLPSYVDDVLEYDSIDNFPLIGEGGKIYLDKKTNLAYRWSGTVYVSISSSIALGETSSTAYAGDKGKKNADDIADLKANKADKTSVYTKEEVDYLIEHFKLPDHIKAITFSVDGILVSKNEDGNLVIGGNVVVEGGISMYGPGQFGDTIMDYIVVDGTSIKIIDGKLTVDPNFVGGGTVKGIKVNGYTYDEVDTNGYITIPDYPTELAWNSITGKPSTFMPSAHTHKIEDITDIADASVSHATTADRLKKEIKIWGQPFDGSTDVEGAISNVDVINMANADTVISLYIKDGVLRIDGDLAVTGGITMYASDGVKSGMIDQVYAVLDQSIFSIKDGVITITGEIGGGTVKAVKIGSTQYDPDSNGIISLPEYPTVTTLEWDNILNKPSSFIPSAHTHPYLPLAGGTMTGVITLTSGSNAAYDKTALSFIRSSDKTEQARIGTDGGNGLGLYANGPICIRPNVTLGSGSTNGLVISSSSFTYNGTAVSLAGHTHSYLPLSGGKLTGSLEINSTAIGGWDEGIRIHTAPNGWCGVMMCGSDNTGSSGTSANTWGVTNYDGNFYINRNASGNDNSSYILCNVNSNWGIGTNSPSYKLHVVGDIYTTKGFKKNGSSDSYVLLGGGGHKAVSDFATSGHTHSYLPLSGGTMNGDIVMGTSCYIYGISETYGSMLHFDGTKTVVGSVGSSTSAATAIRTKTGHVTCGTSGTEYTILDSNNYNTYAVTLTTSQTITGAKAFTAGLTANGYINITGAGDYSEGIRIHEYSGISSVWFRCKNSSGYDAGMWGITATDVGLRFRGPVSTTATSVNDYVNIIHGGNVGIGTTTPGYKLDIYATSDNGIRIYNTAVTKGVSLKVGVYTPYMVFAGDSFDIVYNSSNCGEWSATNRYLTILKSGNIGIGTNSPSEKLHVVGNILASGGITMYSDLRKKNILSDEVLSVKEIAEAPLFAHTYKSDENHYLHIGTSAQYWSAIHEGWFTRKDSEGYYQMELQNLGVAMGISLAREIVKYESKTDKKIRIMKKKINDLEARIKELEGSREERRTA